MRQRHTTVGHIFGANFGAHACVVYVHIAHELIDMRHTTIGHIFGPTFRQMHLLYLISIAHDMLDLRHRYTTIGHIFGVNIGTHAVVIYDTYCA